MGSVFCPMRGAPQDEGELRTEKDDVARAPVAQAPAKPAPPPPASWDPIPAPGCDPELLVLAAIQTCCPSGLRRYLQRRAQVTGFQCFDYTPHADEGFRINVPSHALTIDTELSDEQKAKAAEAGLPESSVILVKVIGVNALSTIEAGDGDRTRLRIVRQVEVEED